MSKPFEHKGPLGSKFEDFEFEANSSNWDSIESALNKSEDSAPLAEKFFADLAPVSVDVWTAIDEELHPKKKRRFVIWWSGIAAGILGLALLNNYGEDSLISSDNPVQESVTNELVGLNKLIFQDKVKSSSRKISENEKQTTTSISIKENDRLENLEFKSSVMENLDQIKTYSLNLPNQSGVTLKREEHQILFNKTVSAEDLLSISNAHKSIKVNAVKLGVSPALALSKMNEENQYDAFQSSSSTSYLDINASGNVVENSTTNNSNTVLLDVMYSPADFGSFTPNSSVEYSLAKSYSLPLSLGGLLNYTITSRLSLSSGFEYTLTSYEFEKGYWKAYQRKGIKGYLGVPIQFSINLLENQKFQVYPLLGGKLFRGVYGKESYVYKNSSENLVSVDERVTNSQFGCSGSIGVGTQIQLYKKLNFYFQATSDYTVLAPLDSYWEDKPISISLQGGLSICL